MKDINHFPLIRLVLLLMLLPAFNKATGTPVENNTPVKSSFTIKINVTGITVSDTVFLSLNSTFYPIADDSILTGVRKVNRDLDFMVRTHDSCGFFSLYIKRPDNKKRSLLMKPFFWERNDDLFINIDFKPSVTGAYSTLQFSGRSKNKYQAFFDIFYDRNRFRADKPIAGLSFYEADRLRIDKQLALLNERKNMLTQLNFEVLRTMIAYEEVPGWKAYAIRKMNAKDTAQKKDFYTGEYAKVQAALGIDKFSNQALLNSFGMLKNRFNILETESNARFGRIDPSWMFRQIMNFPSTILRDRLLVFSFLFGHYDKNADSLFKKANSVITDPVSQKQMRRMSHMLKQSRLKDSFLTDINNQKVLISEKFKGKALLLDFWFRGCGACIILHQNVISKAIKKFENRNDLLFLSINADIEKEKWLNYIKSKEFTTAANEIYLNTNGKGTNDPFIKANNIVHYPTLILLDKNGSVKYFDTTNLRNYEGLAAAIGEVIEN